MRRIEWLCLGLALATATAAAPAGSGRDTYQTLGDLPVQHSGRIKPLDTMAREEVKKIYGRETIKFTDAKGDVIESWGPVAAMLDWMARPDYWDAKDILLVEYLPLKQAILSGPIRVKLRTIADEKATPADARERLRKLAEAKEFTTEDLLAASKLPGLADPDRKALVAFAGKLDLAHKWLSNDDVAAAQMELDGRTLDFFDWVRQAVNKQMGDQKPDAMASTPKLPPLEEKAREVFMRVMAYQALRDKGGRGEDVAVMPRPSNDAYLAYTAEAARKAMAGQSHELNEVQSDALAVLQDYVEDVQAKDRQDYFQRLQDPKAGDPEKVAKFEKKYRAWLHDKGKWLPLRLVLEADVPELKKAGFDEPKLLAFRQAFDGAIESERSSPNALDEARSAELLAAGRDLGGDLGEYPAVEAMRRESHFNRFAPFYKAPMAYGFGLAFLLISVGIFAAPGSRMAAVDRAIYGLGMLGLVGGIALEVYGFYLRIRISGWAPVTNMYETVIWVPLVAAVLGLVLELIYRKKFVALAATGVGLLGTLLAAGFPSVMDPNIKGLPPVLRSNYWLTIHVLTEVSSYAAFALAMGLGLIGTFFYLTATYRRSPRFAELLMPLLPGVPLAALGSFGYHASKNALGPAWFSSQAASMGMGLVFIVGVMMALSPIAAIAGELLNRLTFRDDASLDEAALAGSEAHGATSAIGAASAGGAATATLTKPTVAEIRARSAASRPKLGARERSMQATAAVVKPLSNFIYRAMQVGVLLVAAGTILGGIWADYSWGRFWGWDPKEVWALITLLVYLVPLHGRFAGLINTFSLVAASVACFLSVVMAWYGVNFVLGVGLHSYGFSEGGGQEGVALVAAAVLAVVFGAYWRRKRGSLPAAGAA